jgi:hypothetical protein
MKPLSTLLLCGLASLALAAPAFAAPVAIDVAKLSVPARADLRIDIDKARVSDPVAFREVREIVSHAREANKRARGRKAPTALHLAGLGSKALLPMLELVAFDAAPLVANEGAAERVAVQRDLVEAIGLLRDPRAMPVLVAVLAKEGDFATTRTAAEAIGRLDSDEAASTLVATLANASGERATALLAGMGACHRAVVARTLAARLGGRPDEITAKHVVKSLGHVGNAWAWKTLSDRGDEAAAREAAAKALVTAFVQYTGEVRDAATKALLVVDDVHTIALIEAARRGASADVAVALDELARRVAQNPTR